jgi:hypothetical protein
MGALSANNRTISLNFASGLGVGDFGTLLFAVSASVPILLTAQLLGGVSTAAVTVLTILVTTGTALLWAAMPETMPAKYLD